MELNLLALSIGIGLVVSLMFSELLGLAAGGLVVPGYIALYLGRPLDVAATLAAALLAFFLVRILSTFVIVYGRRRTALMILVGYAAGVLIYELLFRKGGSGPNASFDPRLGPESNQPAPQFAEGDLQGKERVELADVGREHLDRALAIRPKFGEAMAYTNLLHRQKALAYLDAPERWQEQMNAAESWRQRAMAQGGANQEPPKSSHGL